MREQLEAARGLTKDQTNYPIWFQELNFDGLRSYQSVYIKPTNPAYNRAVEQVVVTIDGPALLNKWASINYKCGLFLDG